MSYEIEYKKCMGEKFFAQIILDVKAGKWDTKTGTYEDFALKLQPTEPTEVWGRHKQRMQKREDYSAHEVKKIFYDWYELVGYDEKYKDQETTQNMLNDIFSELGLQPIKLPTTASVR